MLYSLTQTAATEINTDCLIVGVYENGSLTRSAQLLDSKIHGLITVLIHQGDFSGKLGQALVLHQISGIPAKRLLLVGCGQPGKLTSQQYSKLLQQAFNALQSTGTETVAVYLTEVEVDQLDNHGKVRQLVEQAEFCQYRFEQFKKQPRTNSKLKNVILFAAAETEKALTEGLAIAKGTALTRDLGNMPPNICTPAYLAEQAQELARDYPALKVEILEEADMEKLGMGALLAVAKGSRNPAKFIVMHYQAAKQNQAPIVLVGKGVTFDTGGICIKPREKMDEMKYDMCGAASVLGTVLSIAELKLSINVIGLIPTVENMPDGKAYRPGDILTSMAGLTIEVTNTDAEGRLILCDALTYAERFNPAVVIDIATLTGAMIISLGYHTTGFFSNDDKLAAEIEQASRYSNDAVWRLPYNALYQEALNSNFADMVNAASPDAGSITAACFLSRFTENYAWAHLDIAGTAWKTGKDKGAVGRPVPLLVQFLLNHAK